MNPHSFVKSCLTGLATLAAALLSALLPAVKKPTARFRPPPDIVPPPGDRPLNPKIWQPVKGHPGLFAMKNPNFWGGSHWTARYPPPEETSAESPQ